MLRISYVLTLCLLSGCAAVPSCTIGVSLFGPFPVPTASCDITLYPPEDEDDGD
jgi:hypothetical protein